MSKYVNEIVEEYFDGNIHVKFDDGTEEDTEDKARADYLKLQFKINESVD